LPLKLFNRKRLIWCLVILMLQGACSREANKVDEALPVANSSQTPPGIRMVLTTTPIPTFTREAPPEPKQTGTITEIPPASTAVPTILPTNTATPSFPRYQGPPLARDLLGVQVHIHNEDIAAIISHLNKLGVGWVKVQVSWKLYQPDPDRYDQERFGELDRLISRAHANDIKILLSVSKAPEWSRPITESDGPPLDYNLYGSFMSFLSTRYQGEVAAYELWNEPNLQREWNGMPLDAAEFVRLIAAGAAGIRNGDAQAVIVSGAPAVTGINDGLMAIDDRVYLRMMLEAGVANQVDAIGVHPYGWANPPDSSFSNPDPAVPSHNNHPSFFFRDTLSDYATLLEEYDADRQLWATEFGWGSFEGINNKQGTPEPPPENALFMDNVSELEQAKYILQAFSMAQELDQAGPLFLWNLNFGPLLGTQFSESGYSLLRPDGSQRPSYLSLQEAAKK
jgi:polysaccharide biosynthesis protein PslG